MTVVVIVVELMTVVVIIRVDEFLMTVVVIVVDKVSNRLLKWPKKKKRIIEIHNLPLKNDEIKWGPEYP